MTNTKNQILKIISLLLTSNNILTFTLTSITISAIIYISYKIGKTQGMKYLDYANRITIKNNEILRSEKFAKNLKIFDKRNNLLTRALIGMTGIMYLFDFAKELIFELIFKEKIFILENQDEFITFEKAKNLSFELYSVHKKVFKNLEYALYSFVISSIVAYLMNLIFYLVNWKTEKNLEILKNKRNNAVKNLLEDLGEEVSESLNKYYFSKNLKKMEKFKKDLDFFKEKNEKIEKKFKIYEKENKAFKKFLKRFENKFTWCGNCVTSSVIEGKSYLKQEKS